MSALWRKSAASLLAAFLLTVVLGNGMVAAQSPLPSVASFDLCLRGGDVDAGTVAVGQTITVTLCGPFAPGSTETVTVNGESLGTAVAGANGAVMVVISITSRNCGANKVVATGPDMAGAIVMSSGTYSVMCKRAASAGPLAFTGANVFKALLAALLLIAAGAGLVIAQRRRSSGAR